MATAANTPMRFAIVAAACDTCRHLKKLWQRLHQDGYFLIALDDEVPTSCVRDLLWTLQIESLPVIKVDGTLHCGEDALEWARLQGFEVPEGARATSINVLFANLAFPQIQCGNGRREIQEHGVHG